MRVRGGDRVGLETGRKTQLISARSWERRRDYLSTALGWP